ncbi:SusC/RagA family TonB-linked outer membrane protein [Pinibacter aurantiacus]|uniref:TonB-dependent receptor n=1 Tax=Pinibacter aurantiacus TaxID=2851599 RepID=A0A9E2S5Z9_9BACT|nr:TonB-dependent receptor [Pinibacter aurantiacus]MBV4357278.1 TonB-dependent receptor [Pinibacter aurantiacus]
MKLITKKCLLAFSLTLLLGAAAIAQTRTITGTVKDQNGAPLKGVSVWVKGTKTGSTTDDMGNYSLSVDKNAVLILSFTGYASKEIKVSASQSSFTTQLAVADKSLDDVVVVGYGKQKKINMTGAVETISAKQLENRPVTSASALLQGTAPGIVFSTPSGGNTPGSSPTMQIRGQALLGGATSPLVVIDGIPTEGMGEFNSLNPNDIESISVLKDAAASAVYGARAPFGVLVVTTKMAKRNEKPSFTYSGNFSNVKAVRMPHSVDSYTFALSKNQAMINNGNAAPFTTAALDLLQDVVSNPGKHTLEELNPTYTNGTLWGNAYQVYNNNDPVGIWMKTSRRQQHDISIKGGSDKTTYYLSAAYVNQPGILNFISSIDNFKRFNINAGLVSQVNDWARITYRTRYSLSEAKAPVGEAGLGRDRIYQFAYGGWPVSPIVNPNGSYSNMTKIASSVDGGNVDNKAHLLDNILAIDLDLAKGWTVHADGTWRMSFSDYQTLKKQAYEIQPDGTPLSIPLMETSIAKTSALSTYWTVQGYSAYEHNLGKHNLRIQAGAQAEETNNKSMNGYVQGLYMPDLPAFVTGYGTPALGDALSTWATAGFFGRFNYNYDNRYLLELNGRYDGSGRYSADNRWGFFPSASAGWNMSNEKFWESISPIVNRAKLRVSYGTVGNQGNGGYVHVSTMTTGTQSAWIFDGKRLPYVNPPGIVNMDLTWEKFTTANFGLELGFFHNRLTAEFDYFNRNSWDNQGPSTPVPFVLGALAPAANNAAFVTKGWESQLKWTDKINKRWDYTVGFNLSDATSKVTEYNNTTGVHALSDWYVGKQFGEIWGYTSNRLLNQNDFPDPSKITAQQTTISQSKIFAKWYAGDVKYEDLDGDKIISPGNSTLESHGDLSKIGNSTPRYRFAFNFGTGYNIPKAGRVDVSVFLEGVGKRDVFMSGNYVFWGYAYTGSTIGTGIYQGKQMDYYRDANSDPRLLAALGQNVDSYFPRPYHNTGNEGAKNFQTSTRYMLNGAYMRLKNIMATYTLPSQWLNHVKVQNCRIYFSAENIAVLSKMPKYIDPEAVSNGLMYPEQATYSFGVNLGF